MENLKIIEKAWSINWDKVDEGAYYSGNLDVWRFPGISMRETVIEESERICQFRLNVSMNAPWYIKLKWLFCKIKFIEVDNLENENRGGFGITGN